MSSAGWHSYVVNNVARWGPVRGNVRLPSNDVYQLVSPSSATRVVVRFEYHDLEFRTEPLLMNHAQRRGALALCVGYRVGTSCAFSDETFDGPDPLAFQLRRLEHSIGTPRKNHKPFCQILLQASVRP